MKTRLILASLAILAAGCSRDGPSDEEGSKETAVEVASKPFTIGDDVADQMGTHVGDMGVDRDGDPGLNALSSDSDVSTTGDAATPPSATNSQFVTEGGPEG